MSYPIFIGNPEGDYLVLTDEEYHHAVNVKRIKEGFLIEVNDLKGNMYLGEVVKIDKNKVVVKPIEKLHIKTPLYKITLYQCMPNQLSKIDDIIEPVSQLGVDRFVPVLSKNSAVKLSDIEKKIPKWEKIALNSVKQCRRLFPVVIDKPIKLSNINSNDQLKVVFYEKEKENKVKNLIDKKYSSCSVVIGNEGGFDEYEIQELKNKGFISLTLGDYILKMETAIIVGVCQIKLILD
ncbi:RsmE family RNA methyltransferase [Sulfurihydrogenibium sp.]|uniref:RsmE family RNA methyltransferase n=1 Tax=Sulfurihydrogenibium sp. TaxID=2053621 RepID=UPI00261E20D7|nr:RsmE family RNA methyltransferase [Sulfurihydrogenibium sp.]